MQPEPQGSRKPVGYCGIAAYHCVPKLKRPGRIPQSPATYIGQAGTDDLNVEKVLPTDGDGYDPVSCPGGLPVDLRSAV